MYFQLLVLCRTLGPLGLASTISTSGGKPLAVGGYGNLGLPSMAALPSLASLNTTKDGQSKSQPSVSPRPPVSTLASPRTDHTVLEDKVQRVAGQKRARQKSVEEQKPDNDGKKLKTRDKIPKRSCLKNSESRPRDRDTKRRTKSTGTKREASIPTDDDEMTASATLQQRRVIGKPMSLASLAASAAAVAAVGAGTSSENLRCVTVRIGGIEVQVPTVVRGARPPARKVKSVSELEADMHSEVLSWHVIEAALSCDTEDKSGGGELKKLPLRFQSSDEYEDCMTPLLMSECLEQVGYALQAICFSQKLKHEFGTACNILPRKCAGEAQLRGIVSSG